MIKMEKDKTFDTQPQQKPFTIFMQWLNDANIKEKIFPNAFTLATVNKQGKPHARTLLLRDANEDGFIFYTNQESRKGLDLQQNENASMLFYWKKLGRQIEINGTVEKISEDESDKYFANRPRNSQIGAWASDQSKTLKDRETFDSKIDKYDNKFKDQDVTRPPHWGGYIIRPERIEFWQIEEFRLHRRLEYIKTDQNWSHQLLYP